MNIHDQHVYVAS